MAFFGDNIWQMFGAGFNFHDLWIMSLSWFKWMGYMLLPVIAYYAFQYKYKIEVRTLRADGKYNIMYDRGREIKKGGIVYLKMLKMNQTIDMPAMEFIDSVVGNYLTKGKIILFRPGPHDFVPAGVEKMDQSKNYMLYPTERSKLALVLAAQKLQDKFKSRKFWDQYGVIVMNMATITIMFVMFYLGMGALKELAGQVAASHIALRDAAQAFAQCKLATLQ